MATSVGPILAGTNVEVVRVRLTRRQFIALGVSAGAASAVGIVLSGSILDGGDAPVAEFEFFPRLGVATLSNLEDGRLILFDYPLQGQTNVLVKLGVRAIRGVGPDEDVVAFSNVCTHMGCRLTQYRPEWKVLGPCPCHFTTFDLSRNGIPALGQATQNLPQVLLAVEDDTVYATGILRLVYGHASSLQGAEPVVR